MVKHKFDRTGFIRFVPNILTLFRILLVPFFLWLVFYCKHPASHFWGVVVFIIASISDYFDGKIARDMQVVSNFGKIMDPFADKILVISALYALMVKPISYIHPVVFGIIVFREIAVTILREYYVRKKIFIPANIWGKLKTTVQMIGIIASLLYFSILKFLPLPEGYDFTPINLKIEIGIKIYFWIVAIVTFLSGLNYFMVKPEK